MMDKVTEYKPTADILADAVQIIDTAQRSAYTAVNQVLVVRNWLLGKRIAEEELSGNGRDRYGLQVIDRLAEALTTRFGKGFDRRTLYRYVQFYQMFPEIVASVRPQSQEADNAKTVATLWQQSIQLSWDCAMC